LSASGRLAAGGSPAERRWVLWFGLLVMILTSFPYVLGYARQGEIWQFTGFVFGVEDGNSYIAKMISGSYGAWLFKTPYTTSIQRGVIAFLPYLALGKLAFDGGIHEQLVVLYHIFRIGGGMLAVLATYDFLSIIITNIGLRRIGLVLCILGGGLGWLGIILGSKSMPLEFYSPETFGFLSLFGIPHLSLARATFLWSLVIYLRFVSSGDPSWWRQSIRLGLLWLATAVAQPITALVLGILIGLHCLATGLWQILRKMPLTLRGARKKYVTPSPANSGVDFVRDLDSSVTTLPRNDVPNKGELEKGLRKWLGIVLMVFVSFFIPAPFLLYNYFSFSTDPFLRTWTAQNLILSPEPAQYLLAYGLVLPFAIAGIFQLLRRDAWMGMFFTAWMLALPLLAYAPFNLQRRLLEGAWIGLVALAVAGMEGWREAALSSSNTWIKARYSSRWILLLAFPTTIMLIVGGLLATWRPSMPVFRLNDEIQAFAYLRQSASPGEVILASFDTSNALPAWAPLRVVIGHGPESVALTNLRPQVEAVYSSGWSADKRKQFFNEYDVRYVIWGPMERKLGEWDPGIASYLKKAFEVGEFQIFEVIPTLPF